MLGRTIACAVRGPRPARWRPALLVLAGAGALPIALGCRAARAQTVEETLDLVRASSGLGRLAAHADGIRVCGEEDGYFGEHFDWECVFDARRFVIERRGRVSERHCFDGATGWTREITGETRPCELGDLTTWMVEVGAVSGLLLAEGTDLRFTIDPQHTDAREVAMIAGLDRDRAAVRVHIDRASWRARRWAVVVGERRGMLELEGEFEFEGVKFPRVVRTGAVVLTITTIEAAVKDDSRFRMTPGPPSDFSFDPAVASDVPAKVSPGGCLLVRPLINGKEVGWFLLDTGSQMNIIDPDLARAAGLETFGDATLTGIAVEAAPGQFCRAETLSLGPLTIRRPLLMSAKLGRGVISDGVVGVLGMPVFSRSVIELESDAARVGVFDPSTYRLPAGEWMAIHFNRYLPLVPGHFEGRAAVFRLDTGAVRITLDVPTVSAWGLSAGRPLEPGTAGDLDAGRAMLLTRAATFGLGRCTGEDVPVLLATDPAGRFTDTYSNGLVGMEFGRAFVLVFDYAGRRIAAEPPALWPRRRE